MPDTIDNKTLAAQYGFAYAFLKQDPELEGIFKKAVAGGWDVATFGAAVKNTNWFKKTAASAREWILLKTGDPATASERLKQRTSTLTTLANQLGVTASPAALQQMALSSIMSGWDDNQLRKQMGLTYHYSVSNTGKGQAATTVEQMKQIAADYVMPLSDKTIDHWTRQVLEGQATTDDFKAYAIGKAKDLFPTLSDSIDRGISVAAYMDPYKQIAAQTLEIDPESINWLDSKWSKAINQTDSKGNRKPMDLSDWQATIKTDPTYGYDTTSQGRAQGTAMAAGLARFFGKGA